MGYVDEEGHPVCKNLEHNKNAEIILDKAFGLRLFPGSAIYGPLVLLNSNEKSITGTQVEKLRKACETVFDVSKV